jgi:hypothetical protein
MIDRGMFDTTTLRALPLTLYTEQYVIRGTVQTRQHRVSDILNNADSPFLVLEDVTLEEHGTADPPMRAEFAQVNLGSVLFAVTLSTIEPMRELRTPKVAERALVSIPPFRVVGNIHLLPERNLRDALAEFHGHFLPVTDATYWAEGLGGQRETVAMVAVNHTLAQFFAPFREVDPWAGMSAGGPAPPRGGGDIGGGPEPA